MTSYNALGSEFRSLFRQFRASAFRLETLQRYAVWYEEQPLRDFLAGKDKYTHPSHAEWTQLIKDNVSQGKTMSRVHIVQEPLSEYVRFELLWPYADTSQAGEDIRIASVPSGQWPPSLPQQDYWLFDSRLAAVMHYDDDGRFLEADLTEDPGRIREFVEWRNAATATSIPYALYMSSRKIF